nr:uncharacterized protein LOC113803386 [Penaeus vannamei]
MDLSGCPRRRVLLVLVSLVGVALVLGQDGGGDLKEEGKGEGEGERWGRPQEEDLWARRYDGVFSCPCGANNCSVGANNKEGVSGPEVISSTCYLPSTDPGAPENDNATLPVHSNIYKNETALATDYCRLSPNHALCRYSVDEAGPACVKPLKIGLSAARRKTPSGSTTNCGRAWRRERSGVGGPDPNPRRRI